MSNATTVKVSREMHNELLKRSRTLGMTMGDYVERLLRLAMEKTTDDPVEEFKTLLTYARGQDRKDL
jgi:hypothetical protein